MTKTLSFRAALLSALILATFLLGWHIATLPKASAAVADTEYARLMGGGATKSSAMPTPADIGRTIVKQLSSPFYDNGPNDKGIGIQVAFSLARVMAGFILAALVAIPVGFVIGMSPLIYRALNPFIQILKPISPLAWMPLALYTIKDSATSSIFVIFICSIWPMLINTMRSDRHFLIDTVALRTRPKNLNGAGSVTTADLVRSTLRLRPDRIIVGEVRGPEALDMLKAWNTSHPGGIATVHANSALRALHRIEQLVQEAVVTVPRELIAGRSTSSCSSPDAGSTAALPPSPASTGSMRVVATRSPTSSSQPHPKEIIYDQVAHSFDRHGTCRRRTAAT